MKVFWARGGQRHSPVTGTAWSAAATAVLIAICFQELTEEKGEQEIKQKTEKYKITKEDKLSL